MGKSSLGRGAMRWTVVVWHSDADSVSEARLTLDVQLCEVFTMVLNGTSMSWQAESALSDGINTVADKD